jgi:hypothetical protein
MFLSIEIPPTVGDGSTIYRYRSLSKVAPVTPELDE